MYSNEAEQAVLSEIMLDNSMFEKCKLTEDHFYNCENKIIFNAISALHAKGKPFDVIAVGEMSPEDIEYIHGICENTIAVKDNFFSYVEILDKKLKERKIRNAIDIMQLNADKDAGAIQLMNDLEAINTEFEEAESTISSCNDLMNSFLDNIDRRGNSTEEITGVDTGFTVLNEKTSGLQPADLVILGARPSMGKTAFAMKILESALRTQTEQTLFFSIEMPTDGLTDRLASQVGKIPSDKIKRGQFTQEEVTKLTAFAKFMEGKKLVIDEQSTVSPAYMRSVTKKVSKGGPIGLIIVDYLQMMAIPNFKEGRVKELSEITKSLKSLGKEYKCPVVVLSQLSRACEQRPNKRPMNSDLRDSGAIEQDADLILFLYRDEYYNPESEDKGIGEVIIGKNRNGEVGTFRAGFEGRFTRWHDLREAQI